MLALITTIENKDDRYKATQIYKLYRGTMLYIANSILHEPHLAEDAVSEAFIRIIDNLEKIDTIDDRKTRAFVVIIVRNISLDLLRRQNRNQTKPLEDYIGYSEYNEPVFDDIAARDACDKIAKSIARLNKNYSDILYLKMGSEHSNKEIAKILGISQENVKMRLSRARKALKKQLKKEGDFYGRQRTK
ncbi:sigma-70 family RNA polymerase sigma factor [Desulfoscipio sp. XC116]|uniref:RNA polymerase sigma factor n=1 Tax=Desulfoscipio sp. XC116 TaxID=3144975 RepID=UPI00325ABFA3